MAGPILVKISGIDESNPEDVLQQKKNWVIIVIKDVVALVNVSLFHTEAVAE